MIKNIQYYVVNGLFLISLLLLIYWGGSWYAGNDVSPKKIFTGLILVAYSLCMIGFNWPDSKRMIGLRVIGLSSSFIMMIISVLIINDIIGFKSSWSIVVAGCALSLMLASIFQIYRVRDFNGGWLMYYKYGLIGVNVLFFSWLAYLFIVQPGSHAVHALSSPMFYAYALLTVIYFVLVSVKTKAYRPKHLT